MNHHLLASSNPFSLLPIPSATDLHHRRPPPPISAAAALLHRPPPPSPSSTVAVSSSTTLVASPGSIGGKGRRSKPYVARSPPSQFHRPSREPYVDGGGSTVGGGGRSEMKTVVDGGGLVDGGVGED
ncbi:hypothetical protein E3N88_20470 [Mikania micrantha]|uniref:Uncharacterized protein n=1 Tax=Mikania micrantha TaxID=192012 RepID=A0A5N6NJJ5_9ASTR|nr:hypothetical protein E3N88_20470 [Mikania micrantha]